MEVPLDKGPGGSNSFSSRVVVVEVGSNSRVVEAEGGSNFLVDLGFKWKALSVCIGWSSRRLDRAGNLLLRRNHRCCSTIFHELFVHHASAFQSSPLNNPTHLFLFNIECPNSIHKQERIKIEKQKFIMTTPAGFEPVISQYKLVALTGDQLACAHE